MISKNLFIFTYGAKTLFRSSWVDIRGPIGELIIGGGGDASDGAGFARIITASSFPVSVFIEFDGSKFFLMFSGVSDFWHQDTMIIM